MAGKHMAASVIFPLKEEEETEQKEEKREDIAGSTSPETPGNNVPLIDKMELSPDEMKAAGDQFPLAFVGFVLPLVPPKFFPPSPPKSLTFLLTLVIDLLLPRSPLRRSNLSARTVQIYFIQIRIPTSPLDSSRVHGFGKTPRGRWRTMTGYANMLVRLPTTH